MTVVLHKQISYFGRFRNDILTWLRVRDGEHSHLYSRRTSFPIFRRKTNWSFPTTGQFTVHWQQCFATTLTEIIFGCWIDRWGPLYHVPHILMPCDCHFEGSWMVPIYERLNSTTVLIHYNAVFLHMLESYSINSRLCLSSRYLPHRTRCRRGNFPCLLHEIVYSGHENVTLRNATDFLWVPKCILTY